MRNITHVIFDFDGMLTDTWAEAIPYREKWIDLFEERTGLPQASYRAMSDGIRERLRTDPHASWLSDGYRAAPAGADPYVLESAVVDELLQRIRQEPSAVPDISRIPSTPEGRQQFWRTLFEASYPSAGIVFREGAGEFLQAAANLYDNVIVTNSRTAAVQRKLSCLGSFTIPIVGDARKYNFGSCDVPEYCKPEGFAEPIGLRRAQYKRVLDDLVAKGFVPERTAVVGDIFELDLALPLYLGYRCVLLDTEGAQECERQHLRMVKNGFLAKDYREVLECMAKPAR